jgi:hypothetical protein
MLVAGLGFTFSAHAEEGFTRQWTKLMTEPKPDSRMVKLLRPETPVVADGEAENGYRHVTADNSVGFIPASAITQQKRVEQPIEQPKPDLSVAMPIETLDSRLASVEARTNAHKAAFAMIGIGTAVSGLGAVLIANAEPDPKTGKTNTATGAAFAIGGAVLSVVGVLIGAIN